MVIGLVYEYVIVVHVYLVESFGCVMIQMMIARLGFLFVTGRVTPSVIGRLLAYGLRASVGLY